MQPELLLILAANAAVTLLVVSAVGVLFWQRHSTRHREISLGGDQRYQQMLAEIRDRAPAAHDHVFARVEHEHPDLAFVTHDHPHEHEHVVHTHTLEKQSEHEENGRKVVVKRCADCGTIFRDKAV